MCFKRKNTLCWKRCNQAKIPHYHCIEKFPFDKKKRVKYARLSRFTVFFGTKRVWMSVRAYTSLHVRLKYRSLSLAPCACTSIRMRALHLFQFLFGPAMSLSIYHSRSLSFCHFSYSFAMCRLLGCRPYGKKVCTAIVWVIVPCMCVRVSVHEKVLDCAHHRIR